MDLKKSEEQVKQYKGKTLIINKKSKTLFMGNRLIALVLTLRSITAIEKEDNSFVRLSLGHSDLEKV